jgi:hypothetical protein
MLWKDMRGRTKKIHKKLQELDSLCSPYLEERWIGGSIDLDLLSLFPQKYARIMGGIEEEGQAIQSQQWRREKPKSFPRRKKGYLYPLQKRPLGGGISGLKGADNPAPG